MSHSLGSSQWDKIRIFVVSNREHIESLSKYAELDQFMRSGNKPLLNPNQRWCDVADVYEMCKLSGIKCPAPPSRISSGIELEKLPHLDGDK